MNKIGHAMRFHLATWIPKMDVPVGYIEIRISPGIAYTFAFVGRRAKNGNLSGVFYKKQEMKYQFGTLKYPT